MKKSRVSRSGVGLFSAAAICVALAAMIVFAGCAVTPPVRQTSAITIQQRIHRLIKSGISGVVLQNMVMLRCAGIAPWNRPYRFNGIGDCYGYCRQVWNAILADGSPHREDFYPHPYNPKRWLSISGGLPVNDYPDPNWIRFTNPNVLVKGDLLATAQGHFWGANWHGGIYAGNDHNWDSSHLNGLNGAYKRPLYTGFHYYYKPLHVALLTPPPALDKSSGSEN